MVHFKLFKNTNELPNTWDALPTCDIFLKKAFLSALEQSSPANIYSNYLCVYKAEKLVGIAVIQRVQMYTDDIFRNTSSNNLKFLGKKLFAKIVKGNALIIGNLMHTGQHGIFFLSEEISMEAYFKQLSQAIHQLKKDIKKQYQKKIRIIAFKDFFEEDPIHTNTAFFKKENLYKVQVQPNMLFSIPKQWTSTEDYIAAFNKKYRDRYKRARKKAYLIQTRELDLESIKKQSKILYTLYENVSDNAGVNSFKLAPNHFYKLKEYLNEDFKVFGCFLKEELIGFYTLILNDNTIETYFLGYKQDLQQEHQLYLNMLYQMTIYGIDNNFESIVFARTAMEIKSSIGAKPHVMHVYLKHTNNFIGNTFLKLLVKYLNPIRDWQERHPFK